MTIERTARLLLAIQVGAPAANSVAVGDWSNTATWIVGNLASLSSDQQAYAASAIAAFSILVDPPLATATSNLRLTGLNTDPFAGVAADYTALTAIWAAPCFGNSVYIYDGTQINQQTAGYFFSGSYFPPSIQLTGTCTGTTANGSPTVTAVILGGGTPMDPFTIIPGMLITGTGITGGTTVTAVNAIATSANTVTLTLSANATASGTVTLTFKLPAGKNVDVFAVFSAGLVQLRYGNLWTNDTTRADAITTSKFGGMAVNNAAINAGTAIAIAANYATLLGTIRTTATDGQTEDSVSHRYISNYYNRIAKKLRVSDATASWTYTTATWRQVRAQTANRFEVVCCDPSITASLRAYAIIINSNATAVAAATGIGIDSTTVNSGDMQGAGSVGTSLGQIPNSCTFENALAAGYHAINWLEISAATGTTTWLGNPAALAAVQTGMNGTIMC